ncbi:MAG: excinuclease ABC subunit C [Gammaproteobacteria bacterium]|nr:excinuclease ABC subunit C [Gammaproteobacteria bacterium]
MSFDLNLKLQHIPHQPGVYQFLGPHKKPLYIGKAKDLKERLRFYLNPESARICNMLSKAEEVIVTLTGTEEEALRTEFTMIQRLQPPYNILLKDQKSPPFVILTEHEVPQIKISRTQEKSLARHGPYPNRILAQQQIDNLTKSFQIRTCSDGIFHTRKRPCLQYQIGKCSAPCIKKNESDIKDYAMRISLVQKLFNDPLDEQVSILEDVMQSFAKAEEYEKAALIRNQIAQLRYVERQQQKILSDSRYDIIAYREGYNCFYHMIVMHGQVVHSQEHMFQNPFEHQISDILSSLLMQLYHKLSVEWIPSELLIRTQNSFELNIEHHSIFCHSPKTKEQEHWLELAESSFAHNQAAFAKKTTEIYEKQFSALESFFLETGWDSVECIDISHHHGADTSAGVVRYTRNGPNHENYRRYRLPASEDDVSSMHLALDRHFQNLISGQNINSRVNCFFIDGGKTQLQVAYETYMKFSDQLSNILFIAISKGPERKRGLEKYWIYTDQGIQELDLSQHPNICLFAQDIRDEAHRFVGNYRKKRSRSESLQTLIDDLPGISESKKKELLRLFGGWAGLKQVTQEQLLRVPGIGKERAKKIIDFLRNRI